MLKIIISLSMFLIGTLAQAQVQEVRTLENFNEIIVEDGIQLSLQSGNSNSLEIKAADGLAIGNIQSQVKDKVLRLSAKDGIATATVNLWVTGIQKLTLSQASKMEVKGILMSRVMDLRLNSGSVFKGKIKSGQLNVLAKGGSTFDADVTAAEFEAVLYGKSLALLSGSALKARIATHTRGFCNATMLFVKDSRLVADGNSAILAQAEQTLSIDLSSGSRIRYGGSPKVTMLQPGLQSRNSKNEAVAAQF